MKRPGQRAANDGCRRRPRAAALAGLWLGVVAGSTVACADPRLPCGNGTGTAFETYWQVETALLTVLWVVDDSASMCEEQTVLRDNVSAFLAAFEPRAVGARFHMGVVSTDTSSAAVAGRLRNDVVTIPPIGPCANPPAADDCTTGLPNPLPKFVDETTPDLDRVFRCLAFRGVGGSEAETPLGAVRMALSPALLNDPAANQGFFIEGSVLAIVIVGDEDDCSVCSGATCAPLSGTPSNLDCAVDRVAELTPVEDLVEALLKVAPFGAETLAETGVLVASVIGHDAMGNSTGPVAPDPGGADAVVPLCAVAGVASAAPSPRIEAFTRRFDDRIEASLCADGYGDEVAAIGSTIGAVLTSGCLQLPPCPGASADQIVVRVTDEGATTELTTADYDLSCAVPPATCPESSNADCAYGFHISFTSAAVVPPGALVDVVYAFDTGDGCAGDSCPR